MKLLTINTHSLVEENYEEKLQSFVEAIIEEQPDIIAMQEVNQSIKADIVCEDTLENIIVCQSNVKLRKDNYALRVAIKLHEAGIKYYWTWIAFKEGYERFDEGLALFSRHPITDTDSFLISTINDYNNWKTRKVLGIRSNNQWFYTVHMGWWNDEEEPFIKQWERLLAHLESKEKVWLMGDFNSRADVRNEGYDMVNSSGWIDTYSIAEIKDDGITAHAKIDGWKEKTDSASKMRIDYIWCNYKTKVKSSKVIFNGANRNVISDHYGVIIETYQ